MIPDKTTRNPAEILKEIFKEMYPLLEINEGWFDEMIKYCDEPIERASGKTAELIKLLIAAPNLVMFVSSKKIRRRIITHFKLSAEVSRRIKISPIDDFTFETICWFDEKGEKQNEY